MGIGFEALMIYEEVLHNDELTKCSTVMELGAQVISTNYQDRAKYVIATHNAKYNYKGEISAKDFYLGIGFKEYNSIDADGERGSLIFDLNLNIKEHYNFDKKYDLVTNIGTSEHVFNQNSCFENIHNLTNDDGYMLHIVPFEGGFNHGFINYNPILFYDLAIYNNYEIIGFWYMSERPSHFTTYSGRSFVKPLKYNNSLMNYINELAKKKLLICTPLSNGSSIAVMYKKTQTNMFRVPFQSIYIEKQEDLNITSSKLKTYLDIDTNKIEEIFNINANVDHNKQIDEVLGGGYWKTREFWKTQKKTNFSDIKSFYLFLKRSFKRLFNYLSI